MRTILTLTLFLPLLPLTLVSAKPQCSLPPPPPSAIPSLNNCYALLEDLFAISKLEDDEPIIWTRNPPLGQHSTRKLPALLKMDNNDCAILVDTLSDESVEDAFPMKDVAARGVSIVRECLDPEGPQGEGKGTIGAEVVGKKRGLVVVLMKEFPIPGGGSGGGGRGGLADVRWLVPVNGSRKGVGDGGSGTS